ncbi:uncharacterized protein [Miscanthus floridulus]|uniref:uncharacterized protein n=1 Tax=Miscanthus floridulus TaxID=154761 RepID=UPI0034599211
MGNPDPTDLINAEVNRIPFRAQNFSLNLWKDTFRSWPKTTKGWKDWYLRVNRSMQVYWAERKLDQCIRLSIADMQKNESMIIAAAYFWSDTTNTFMFGHGPATPTLADVHMLTGLDISTADEGSIYGRKPEYRVNTRNIGGWTGYIQEYQKTGTPSQREHATFLNMWLEKFIFCGRSVGPTNAFLPAAELLANGVRFPLGRYLLSSTYHLLHQVSQKLLLGEPIGNLGGPWWFINMWLNAHMHKRLQWDFFAQQFPREIAEDYVLGDDESATRSPLNFGEAIIVLPGTEANEDQIGRFFQSFYNGLSRDHRAWVPYIDEENRFPLLFNFADDTLNQDNELMMAIITPRAIPVNTFGSGKNTNITYEFYNPSAVSRQLAFGQLPIKLCFADVIKPRETITCGTDWNKVVQLSPDADTTDVDISTWTPISFITESYKQWWREWKEQLFATSAHTYRHMIDSEYAIPDDAVNNPAPSVSKSGKPFNLRPISPTSPIGYNAPTLAALTHQKIRTKTITSKSKLATSRATPSAAATTLVKAFKGVRAATGSSSAIPPISSTTPSEQQLGTSANVPDAQASQPTSVDAPQPIIADVQAKRKASTDTEAQPKRQRSMPIPASAPMSSVIIPQEPTTDEVTEDIPSASSADPHDILQVASSSQAQEIALKQEQDSPNSLFSFAIDISDDDGEETSSSLALGTISLCADCVTTKLKRTPFLSQAKRRTEGLLDLVHGDLCGPISPATPGGKQYFLLLVDDRSRYMWVALLAVKSDTLVAMKKFQAWVEVETGRRLRMLRTDNGGEFTSVEFESYCSERGGEAVATAVYLLNRAPTKALDGVTPYEAWHGRKPNVHYFRTFGCIAYVKSTKPYLKNLDDRGTPVVFIG